MYNLLLTILLILSVFILIAIFMQPTKNQSSNVLGKGAHIKYSYPINKFI